MAKKKVIFLEIDGVLNNDRSENPIYRLKECILELFGKYFYVDINKCRILRKIKDRCWRDDVQIVIIGRHRYDYFKQEVENAAVREIHDKLDRAGLHIAGKTMCDNRLIKAFQIMQYLEDDPDIKEFVILDSNMQLYMDYKSLIDHVVGTRETKYNPLTSKYEWIDGLRRKHIKEALRILDISY